MKKKVISLLLSFIFIFSNISLNIQAESKNITGNEIGNYEGFGYELWKDSGTTSMTLYDNGTFDCSWSDINNALFRRGQKFDRTKTHEEIGNMTVEFGCDYQPSGNSYLCVYGWTLDPLVEFYVIDSWGTWRPPGATAKATITVDGGTYDIYETTRVEQPSIVGTKTFQQYWSVRTDKRTEGTISISQHFKEWEKLGMEMGKMYEVAFLVEGYQSSGTAYVYNNTLNIDKSVTQDENEDSNQDENIDENTDEKEDISSDNNPKSEKTNISIKVGKKTTLKINNKVPKSTYKWSTNNKKVATVTKKGVVKGIKKGKATITCKITAPKNKFTIKYKIKVIK